MAFPGPSSSLSLVVCGSPTTRVLIVDGAPEIGSELIGGSEREPDLEELKKNLVRQGEDLKVYEWYLDTRRYGSVEHAGFGMGVDRVVRWVTLTEHIRDTIPFPRTPARYRP